MQECKELQSQCDVAATDASFCKVAPTLQSSRVGSSKLHPTETLPALIQLGLAHASEDDLAQEMTDDSSLFDVAVIRTPSSSTLRSYARQAVARFGGASFALVGA